MREVSPHVVGALMKSRLGLVGVGYLCVKGISCKIKPRINRKEKNENKRNCCRTYDMSEKKNLFRKTIGMSNIIVNSFRKTLHYTCTVLNQPLNIAHSRDACLYNAFNTFQIFRQIWLCFCLHYVRESLIK